MSNAFFRLSPRRGEIGKIRPGAAGLMASFLGWRQAFKSVMRRDHSQYGAGPVRIVNSDRRSRNACTGRRRGRRDDARSPGACRRSASQSPLVPAGVRLERLLYRRTYRLQPRRIERGAVGSGPRRLQRQFQRRHRRRAGRLQCSTCLRPPARRRSRSHLSELSALELDHSRGSPPQTPTSPNSWIITAPCAAVSATPQGHWLVYATGGFAFAGERFLNSPAVGDEEKIIHRRLGWAAGAGVEYGFAPHWSVRLEYLYSQFERDNVRFPSGAQLQFDARLPADPHRPQPQGRLAGIEQHGAEDRYHRS